MNGRGQGNTALRIRDKLHAALAPVRLEVIDDSHKHSGHAHVATKPGRTSAEGETHFRIKVVSEAFKGKSRVDRHRMVNTLLSAEIADGVHALAIDAKTPDE